MKLRSLKILSVITYFIISINVGHFTAPLIWVLYYGLINPPEGFWLIISTIIICFTILIFIWTIILPKTKRDKILVPIISIILNIPFIYIFIAHNNWFIQKGFIVTFTLFFTLTVLHLTIEYRQAEIDNDKNEIID
jgi:phosphatidylserine synthase